MQMHVREWHTCSFILIFICVIMISYFEFNGYLVIFTGSPGSPGIPGLPAPNGNFVCTLLLVFK